MLSIPMACEFCGIFKGHLATCKTSLEARDQRVAYIAWRPMVRQIEAEKLGISAMEYVEGRELGHLLEAEDRSNRDYYGDPAYGSRDIPAEHRIVQSRVMAMMQSTAHAKDAAETTTPEAVHVHRG